MKTKISFALVLLLILSACKEVKEKADNSIEEVTEVNTTLHEETKHWSYEGETGPIHWDEFEKDSDCGGVEQSPINIIDLEAVYNGVAQPIAINYAPQTKIHEVLNNGHTIKYVFDKIDSITVKDEVYELKQIHFHESSEHTVNGVRYPLEIHMVHASKNKKYAVLSVLVKEGENSAPFQFLESYLPLQIGETKAVDMPFDLNTLLPENRDYYSYVGSLTTPPCTQGVLWFVFKEPITVSVKQVNELKALMPVNNYRGEQALNGRAVLKTFK